MIPGLSYTKKFREINVSVVQGSGVHVIDVYLDEGKHYPCNFGKSEGQCYQLEQGDIVAWLTKPPLAITEQQANEFIWESGLAEAIYCNALQGAK